MKVADIMQKQVDYVSLNSTVKDVSRLIFGRGINGVPVCQGKKIVGFVTERDILSKFYPSIEEYMEDPVHTGDFEGMEKNVSEILDLPIAKIMSKNPITVTADTPILRAQSLMFVNKVGRLPVVDAKDNLVGILSKGDIFQAIVGQKIPAEGEERFYDWQAKHYDLLVDWKKRLPSELKDLLGLFNKQNVKKVLDLAYGTGEHSIALAKNGFETVGVESSSIMQRISEQKRKGLSKDVASRTNFFSGVYKDMFSKLSVDFDAAIFLGNVLPHVIITDKNILKMVSNILNPKKSVMVFQILNFDKVLNVKDGLQRFVMKDSAMGYEKKHAFLGFYSKDRGKTVTYAHTVFDYDGYKWMFRGMKSTTLLYVGRKEIAEMLKGLGYKQISFYGSNFEGRLFGGEFKPLESDYLNVVATK